MTSTELQALCAKIASNDLSFTMLNLNSKEINDDGAQAIALVLIDNEIVEDLCFNKNNIGDAAADAVALLLKNNKTLKTLELDWNIIGFKGAQAIAEALKGNKSLKVLSFGRNNIGDEGAKAIAEALKHNKTLKTLSLSLNNIGVTGAQAIAETLKDNNVLESLDLEDNNIGDEGAKAIAEALKDNEVLESLNLEDNNIGDEGAKAILEALKVNKTLTTLKLSANFNPSILLQINALLYRNKIIKECKPVFAKIKTVELKESPENVLKEFKTALIKANEISDDAQPSKGEFIIEIQQAISFCEALASLKTAGILNMRQHREFIRSVDKPLAAYETAISNIKPDYLKVARDAIQYFSSIKPGDAYYNMAQEALKDLSLDMHTIRDSAYAQKLSLQITTLLAQRESSSNTQIPLLTLQQQPLSQAPVVTSLSTPGAIVRNVFK